MDAYDIHDFAAQPLPVPPQLAHIPAPDLAEAQREQIIQWLQYLYIPSADIDALTHRLTQIITRNKAGRPGAKRIAVVTAPNGVGKSTALMEYSRHRYQMHFAGRNLVPGMLPIFSPAPGVHAAHIPVVWLNVRSGAGRTGMDASICEYFGLGTRGKRDDLTARAVHALRTHRVETVIVDDAHLLWTHKVGGRELLDHLKVINTEIGVVGATLVLIGAELEGSDLLSDPQIKCRSVTMTLPEYDLTAADNSGRIQYQRILADIENLLRANVPGIDKHKLSRRLAPRIAERVGGRHGDLVELVVEATTAFISDPSAAKLTREHIDAAEITDRARQGEQTVTNRIRARRAISAEATA